MSSFYSSLFFHRFHQSYVSTRATSSRPSVIVLLTTDLVSNSNDMIARIQNMQQQYNAYFIVLGVGKCLQNMCLKTPLNLNAFKTS